MKLKIHSVVDLITNSSTVIFTYSEGSLPALKELVNEMLKTFGMSETFDDVFYAGVFFEEDYHYIKFINNHCPELEMVDYNYLKDLKHKILIGEEEKPDWMIEAEEYENYDYRKSTILEIIPKNPKDSKLAKLLIDYLYSTDHDATRDN